MSRYCFISIFPSLTERERDMQGQVLFPFLVTDHVTASFPVAIQFHGPDLN